jgi:hypothetical protein
VVGSVGGAGLVGGAGVVGDGGAGVVGDGGAGGAAGAVGAVVVVGGAELGNGFVSVLRSRASVKGLPSRVYVVTPCGVSATGPDWAGEGGAAVGESVLWTWEGSSGGSVDRAREGVERAGEGVGVAGVEPGAGGWVCVGLAATVLWL